MVSALRTFLDLLPYRMDQAIAGHAVRKLRVKHQRRRLARPTIRTADVPRRLFVDLAVISKHDAGTGIQRVVRALALGLIKEGSTEWDICFVSASRRQAYHRISWPDPDSTLDSDEMEAQPGDIFLGLDFSLDAIRQHRGQLAKFRRDGGSLWFLVCDLLPVERPEWFSRNNVIRYKAWLEILAGLASGFLCISRQTEMDLTRVLRELYGLTDSYHTAIVPMGHDILGSLTRSASGENSNSALRFDPSPPFILMVGTIEPRKGHADVIAAFDELWREGAPSRLVLVGRVGWRVENLHKRIMTHSKYGEDLVWLDDVEDLELEGIYEACEGVIVASHGEGFGLPLIEALGHGKPVLARNLPIFRVHEDRGVRYFPTEADPRSLAQVIREWISEARMGKIVIAQPNTCWRESTKTLLTSIERAT